MSDVHWDQIGMIVGVAGFALHWVARVGALAQGRTARSLHHVALAMMTFGAWGILMVVQGTPGTGEMVRQGLLILALALVAYFLWRAWSSWPTRPAGTDGFR